MPCGTPTWHIEPRLVRPDALRHGIGASPHGHLLDASHSFVAVLGNDVGRAKLAGAHLLG